MKRLVVASFLLYAAVAFAVTIANVRAAEPVSAPAPAPWPGTCLAAGNEPGDVFGPGPNDVYPDLPPCPPVSAPASQPSEEAYVGGWLPSTDADQSPAVVLIAIWIVAAIVIIVAWYRLAYRDD